MEKKKTFGIGETVPMEKAERSDTFFMVTINGQKYLVDQSGKIVLKPPENGNKVVDIPLEAEKMTDPLKFRVKAGTPEFSQAVKESSAVLENFNALMHRHYRLIAPNFAAHIEKTRASYIRYFEKDKDSLANIKAYLIHEFFSHTTLHERGLQILEFLTYFIAQKIEGTFANDRNLSSNQQRDLILEFLGFLAKLGDTPTKKIILEKTYLDFVNQEFELMKGEGGVGHYVSTSFSKALKAQKEFLSTPENRNYLESAFQSMMRSQLDFFLDNILAYVKAMAILRLIANSRKEERGQNEAERETLLYEIIAYRPPWYS